MVVIRSSVSLSVCLSVCLSVHDKHVNISRTTEPILTKFCTHIFQKKSMSQIFFWLPRVTLGWVNPDFDFFAIPLSPLKAQKKFQIFLTTSVLSYSGSVFSQKNLGFCALGSSGRHNHKIQGQIYPIIVISQEPGIGIQKIFLL